MVARVVWKFQRFFAVVLCTFFSKVIAQSSADFFIAEEPASFEILNQYQQKIDQTVQSSFRPFTPWKIIEENALLSDQYTKVMHVDLKGKDYFFVKNAADELQNSAPSAYQQIFNNCVLVNDTIIIIQKKAVLFKEIPLNVKDNSFKSSYLQKEVVVNRLFKKESDYFVQLTGNNQKFGWIRVFNEKGIERKKKEVRKNVTSNSANVLEQVKDKIKQVNVIYSHLFTYMNNSYGQKKEIPQWQLTETKNGFNLSLSAPDLKEKLKKSTAYFLADLQFILKNSSYALSISRDSYEVFRTD